MPSRSRAFTLIELMIVIFLLALLATLLLPLARHNHGRADRTKCANDLRQLALGCVQYCDDKGAFPHVGATAALDRAGNTDPQGSDVAPRCLRSLVYFGYLDNPEVFICPASVDQHTPFSPAVKANQKLFGWGGTTETWPASPIAVPGAKDGDLAALDDLSYGYTVKGLTMTSVSNAPLAADRARVHGDVTASASGLAGKIGNHRDGWSVVYVDAHAEFVHAQDARALGLASTGPTDGCLTVYDETNNAEK